MSGRQFHMTLPSNVNNQGNTIANYVTTLPNRMELDGEWEVALVEIAYPVSWHNLPEGEYFQLVDLIGNVLTERIPVPEGRYETPVALVNAMRTAWLDYWEDSEKPERTTIKLAASRYSEKVTVTSLSIRFDEKTNKVKFKLADVTHALKLSPILADMLTILSHSWSVLRGKLFATGGKTYERAKLV